MNFYKTADGKDPIREFLDELPKKLRAKNLWEIGMLEEFGVSLPMPYAKQLSGKEADGLWELRVKLSSDITRIFYFFPHNQDIILLHGFVKKTDETPPEEIRIAQKRKKDHLERGL